MHKIKVSEIREIKLKNFNPMCWHLISYHGLLKGYIQAKIDFLGILIWVNLKRNEVILSRKN